MVPLHLHGSPHVRIERHLPRQSRLLPHLPPIPTQHVTHRRDAHHRNRTTRRPHRLLHNGLHQHLCRPPSHNDARSYLGWRHLTRLRPTKQHVTHRLLVLRTVLRRRNLGPDSHPPLRTLTTSSKIIVGRFYIPAWESSEFGVSYDSGYHCGEISVAGDDEGSGEV